MTSFPGNSSKTRFATTEQLLSSCLDSNVKRWLEEALDPGGVHVLRTHFFHDSNLGLRTVWLVKTHHNDFPEVAVIDMAPSYLANFEYFEDVYEG